MLLVRKTCLALAALALIALLAGLVMDAAAVRQSAAVVAAAGLSLGLGALPSLKSYQFTAWILR